MERQALHFTLKSTQLELYNSAIGSQTLFYEDTLANFCRLKKQFTQRVISRKIQFPTNIGVPQKVFVMIFGKSIFPQPIGHVINAWNRHQQCELIETVRSIRSLPLCNTCMVSMNEKVSQ